MTKQPVLLQVSGNRTGMRHQNPSPLLFRDPRHWPLFPIDRDSSRVHLTSEYRVSRINTDRVCVAFGSTFRFIFERLLDADRRWDHASGVDYFAAITLRTAQR